MIASLPFLTIAQACLSLCRCLGFLDFGSMLLEEEISSQAGIEEPRKAWESSQREWMDSPSQNKKDLDQFHKNLLTSI